MQTSQPLNNPVNENVRCERRDVQFKPVVVAIVGLLALVVLVAAAVVGLFQIFAARTQRPPSTTTAAQLPPAHELQQLRPREFERLTSYGWVSREQGIVHIPIERAMELVIEEARSPGETQ